VASVDGRFARKGGKEAAHGLRRIRRQPPLANRLSSRPHWLRAQNPWPPEQGRGGPKTTRRDGRELSLSSDPEFVSEVSFLALSWPYRCAHDGQPTQSGPVAWNSPGMFLSFRHSGGSGCCGRTLDARKALIDWAPWPSPNSVMTVGFWPSHMGRFHVP
jgi:hypothetical protein